VISIVFWAAVAVCAVAQLFIVAAAVRARSPGGADSSFPHSSRAVEIGWTIVPALGLALLLFFTHRALEARAAEAPSAAHSSVGVTR
jgi:heme/copper-type cytochrome/quinol oxidase subunit 2